MMPFRLLTALPLLAISALPASAQWVAAGRWGSENSFRYVAPGTWMVQQLGERVQVTAEGDNHSGRIEFWCDADAPAGRLIFSGYRGEALNASALGQDEPRTEPVRLAFDGETFERVFTYRPEHRDWTADAALDSELLDAFAWGARMELLNAEGERVTAYRLNGSGAAREALRRTCGI